MSPNKLITLSAAMLVTFVLGSVHAFSVFIVPLETQYALPRSEVSLIYSLALIALTLAVLYGYRIYALLPPAWLAALSCVAAGGGLALASTASGWWLLMLGYSLIFGFANGLGYGFCLQLVGQAVPEIKGFAMGAVTAAYAMGSIIFAKLIAWLLAAGSVAATMQALALIIAAGGIVAGISMAASSARYAASRVGHAMEASIVERRKVVQFWLAYMTSVFAGLMAIGHAAGIALAKNATFEQATWAAIAIGSGSAVGGFASGWLVDRMPVGRLLITLAVLSMLALLACIELDDPHAVVAMLTGVGFAYGSTIAIYPVAISNYFAAQGPRVYGLVFTAWGFAGLAAPWSAGILYDWYASYTPGLTIAVGLAFASALCVWRFRLQ